MPQRPRSVTIISWFLIVTAVVSMATSWITLDNPLVREMMSRSPVPLPVQIGILYTGLVIHLIAAVAMLKGMNWGRILYASWSVAGILFSFATSPVRLAVIPSAIVVSLVIFLLFRPKPNAYFQPQAGAAPAAGEPVAPQNP